MKFILGKKLNMTQVFREDGTVVPVTRVKAGPCVVTQVKTLEKDGVNSVQVGFEIQKRFRLNKPENGHLKDINIDNQDKTVRILKEFRTDEINKLKKGDFYSVKTFTVGEKVTVVGKAKGRGFQGVVKRHNFGGSPASHGHKDQLRMPGSIGATDPARVFKGTRMAGHMGDNRVTVKNLEIIAVDEEKNELLIKGAVPGARNSLLLITSPEGELKIELNILENKSKSTEKTEVKEEKEETKTDLDDKQVENSENKEKIDNVEKKDKKTETKTENKESKNEDNKQEDK